MEIWQKKDSILVKDFKFKGFTEAVNFVNKVADLANKANHHPDILIHGYSNVEIRLTTHSALSMVTQKDHDLAKQIDAL